MSKKTSQPAQRAPRREYEPLTTFPRMTALRQGASDFVQAPSLRNGQRVPFCASYVPLTQKNKE